ncbi:MAG: DNA replication/repair protein RecF [Clostridia bacterium]
MLVEKLRLTCFRNYESIIFVPQPKTNLLMGDNGVGKTNLLEALFMCAFLRSHRTSRDNDLISFSQDGAYIGLTILNESGEHEIAISLKESERKQVFVDKIKVEKLGDAMGIFNVVMFAPEDLSLVKGSPSERRQFLDMELSSLSKKYFFTLQRYMNALKQRNKLLKNASDLYRPGIIEPWDEILADTGAVLFKERNEFCELLNAKSAPIAASLTGNRESLKVKYLPYIANAGSAEGIMAALRRSRDDDIRRGTTTVGLHRDDIDLSVNGDDVKNFCSQGQQRSVALSIKLATLEIVRESRGTPVLLLDDVFSELDQGRREALLDAIRDCQCFLTSTEDYVLDRVIEMPDVAVWMCKHSEILLAE